jgi:hypothetical protein
MSQELAQFFGGHQAPNTEKLIAALAGFASTKQALSGKALLKLTKQGAWVFGADNEALRPGTRLVVNPASLSSGYIAWHKGVPEGEKMQPLSQGPVDATALPEVQGKNGWQSQASVEMIVQGELPLHLLYKTSSMGGLQALLSLAGEIAFGMSDNPARAYPELSLGVDSYDHTEYGVIYKPVVTVERWLDTNGEEVTEKKRLV